MAVPRADEYERGVWRGRACNAPRTRRRSLVVTSIALALILSGCPLGRERICRRGEHVVRSIDAPDTGRICVRDGQPPPKGYEEYPPGKVPTYLDEDR